MERSRHGRSLQLFTRSRACECKPVDRGTFANVRERSPRALYKSVANIDNNRTGTELSHDVALSSAVSTTVHSTSTELPRQSFGRPRPHPNDSATSAEVCGSPTTGSCWMSRQGWLPFIWEVGIIADLVNCRLSMTRTSWQSPLTSANSSQKSSRSTWMGKS